MYNITYNIIYNIIFIEVFILVLKSTSYMIFTVPFWLGLSPIVVCGSQFAQ
jgi:hypothetical protein